MLSGPEIKTGYGQVGRDTLAAIAEELQAAAAEGLTAPERVRAFARAASSPEIAIEESLAGRETLAAINEELLLTPMRGPMATLRYGDRISNAPGARVPSAPPFDNGPEISISSSGVGRETLAAINEDLTAPVTEEPTTGVRPRAAQDREPPSSSVQPTPTGIEVFEMMTFVARGEVSELASTTARRAFVEERLLHRLPVTGMAEVDRIDVTPWTVKGTVIVRVWCIVPPRAAKSSPRRASG
ncbi:MAG TPA: hypothetical protein VI197_11290 [Polyangiaceae bacterium]